VNELIENIFNMIKRESVRVKSVSFVRNLA
jgi:hypothetical protein